jgi:uncharacterized protein
MKPWALVLLVAASNAAGAPPPDRGALAFTSLPDARFHFTGLVGNRVDANVDEWLLRAPQANPGMLEMFRMRDRAPVPQLVPWAGEFIGKYLVSAISSLPLTEDPRLSQQISNVVAAFIATQAEDGYLGSFPKDARLLKNWDLWGHYHALCALLLWHERTGDPAALAAARKAADLVCSTYLDTSRRVIQAGDHEMNMSILTGLVMVYRATGETRYLRMAHEVEKDWEATGDYLRAGLDGREFYESPRPRWESLHNLQGLLELWRATGEQRYRQAFTHHWRSIRRCDRRNTGGFSSGEQATGNPYAPSAIETCCTVAWMALTLDYLKLTGDPRAADDLELATCNAGLGAQHPSGRWCTYNTPMDGVREASAHTIVFQARAGTPELNCCSVNGPRVPGLLSQWALMSSPDGLVLNTWFPGAFIATVNDQKLGLTLDRDYPNAVSQRVKVTAAPDREWTLHARIPAWSTHTRIKATFGDAPSSARAGTYLAIRRHWRPGDEIEFEFDANLRPVMGAHEMGGKASLYRGPVLLAWDQAFNSFDENAIPALNLARLREATVEPVPQSTALRPAPWVQVNLSTDRGGAVHLVDFATAGALGTHYRTWLAVTNPPPPPALTRLPRDGESLPPGPVLFQWRGPRRDPDVTYQVETATNDMFTTALLATNVGTSTRATLDLAAAPKTGSRELWWRVVTRNSYGETIPDTPAARFTLDAGAPAQRRPHELKPGPNGEVILHHLRVDQPPTFGELVRTNATIRDSDGVTLNGQDQLLDYALSEWPEEDFTVAVRVRINQMPTSRIGQIFSAWAAGMDDPLRLVVDRDRVFARVEAGSVLATPGVEVKVGEWHLFAAVKRGSTLTLFCDGQSVGSTPVPQFTTTTARDCALGGNPHFGGNECLAATFAEFGLWTRALSQEEMERFAWDQPGK